MSRMSNYVWTASVKSFSLWLLMYWTGAYPELELQTRLFYRRIFLNLSVSSSEKSFWLHLILQPFPMVHQARVLFLLYGPMCGGNWDLDWTKQSIFCLSCYCQCTWLGTLGSIFTILALSVLLFAVLIFRLSSHILVGLEWYFWIAQ